MSFIYLVVIFIFILHTLSQPLSNWSCPSDSQINFCWTSNWFTLSDCTTNYDPYVIQNPTIYNQCPVCLSCRPKVLKNCFSLADYENCINNVGLLPTCDIGQAENSSDPCCFGCRKQCVEYPYLPVCTDLQSINIYGCHICRSTVTTQKINQNCDLTELPVCNSKLELINNCPVCEPFILHPCTSAQYSQCNTAMLPTCANYFKNKVELTTSCCPVCLPEIVYLDVCTDDQRKQCFHNIPLCEDGIDPLYLNTACCPTCKKVESECTLEQLTQCFNLSLECPDQAVSPHLSHSCCRSCYQKPNNNNCTEHNLLNCKFDLSGYVASDLWICWHRSHRYLSK
jgi:hypothetical protein